MNIYLEIFGYVGTALVICSMMMTSLLKLRIINICGSLISMIYSFACHAYPVAVMNFCLILINAYQAIRQVRRRERYGHLSLLWNDVTLTYFLELYQSDIQKLFPNYRLQARENTEIHMIYVGSEAVGVLVGTRVADLYRIEMDYVVPRWRDVEVGSYFMNRLKEQGIRTLTAPVGEKEHNRYLLRMGFADEGGILLKEL